MSTQLSPVASAVSRVAAAMGAPPANASATTLNAPAPGDSVESAPLGNGVAGTGRSTDATPTTVRTTGATVKPELSTEQKAALKHLHATAQQFESLFVNMLFKSMRAASPQTSITGEKLSPAETTFTEMLDEKRSESLAQTGSFGIAKILEDQLKDSVLANPAQAAKARLAPEGVL